MFAKPVTPSVARGLLLCAPASVLSSLAEVLAGQRTASGALALQPDALSPLGSGSYRQTAT
jgi:hypothetical protein